MTCKVRYLREDAIELDANDLLGEYSLARGVPVAAPIPVEHLLEFHLGLSLDFDNLHERLGIPLTGDEPDVLGALWVDSRAVFVELTPVPALPVAGVIALAALLLIGVIRRRNQNQYLATTGGRGSPYFGG